MNLILKHYEHSVILFVLVLLNCYMGLFMMGAYVSRIWVVGFLGGSESWISLFYSLFRLLSSLSFSLIGTWG